MLSLKLGRGNDVWMSHERVEKDKHWEDRLTLDRHSG